MAINWDDMQLSVIDPDTFVITSDEDVYTLNAEQRMISFVGKQGERGEPGDKGEAATIEIISVQTLPPDSRNYVENVGDSHNAKLIFGLAQGEQGEKGRDGDLAAEYDADEEGIIFRRTDIAQEVKHDAERV